MIPSRRVSHEKLFFVFYVKSSLNLIKHET
nr:MAG TPA: hypothetical protein [Caudoviricetes sp.]